MMFFFKALQLANSKLIHDGFFFTEGGINVHHLERMAAVLNKWIVKERSSSEEVGFQGYGALLWLVLWMN